MKNSQKGFIVPFIIVIAIIAVLVIAGGVYFFEQSKPQQSEQQPITSSQTVSTSTTQTQTSASQIAGWKTYTNTEYGFEFKYPNYWTFEENSVFDSESDKKLLVRYISKEQNSAPAPTYCMANKENSRCQSVKVYGNYAANIDWQSGGENVAYIDIYSPDGGRVEIYITDFIATDKAIVLQILSTFKFTSVVSQSSLPTTCTEQQEGTPVITSLSSNSGPVGTTVEVRGCNFAGFESDLNVWIENSQGVKGILYSEPGSTAKSMKIVLKSQACQTDESYRGLPCASYLTLTPGTYKIYTIPWGKKSNVATFTVTSNAVVSPIPKEGDSRLDAKCLETYPNLPERNWCYEIYRSGQWMRIN